MAFSFTSLRYGWLILTGITLGTSIFVINNQRKQIEQVDVIEIVVGTYERCLATEYATNPSLYYANPRDYTNKWITTNGLGGYVTNEVTNAFGWRIYRSMLTNSDPQIKELVPYYCDSNGVPLTVTGLWAQLGIGDGVSEFTSIPAMGTNAATYGELPWRIYITNLVERYMVLNALKYELTNSITSNILASIKGNAPLEYGGYADIWYPLYGDNLGQADGVSEYAFTIDGRNFEGSGGLDYIGMGMGGASWGIPEEAFQITLDSSSGSDFPVFWATLTVSNAVILGGVVGNASDGSNPQISLVGNTITFSATLDRHTEAFANFGVIMVSTNSDGMITNDFYYCTNKYW